MIEGDATIYIYRKGARARATVYISQDVVKDSTFPFRHGEKLKARIEGRKLVLSSKILVVKLRR